MSRSCMARAVSLLCLVQLGSHAMQERRCSGDYLRLHCPVCSYIDLHGVLCCVEYPLSWLGAKRRAAIHHPFFTPWLPLFPNPQRLASKFGACTAMMLSCWRL
eukprot:6077543-Amphidinium_carterae.4